MLLDSGVPPVRAYLMWAAVAFRTRLKTGMARLVAMVAWIVVALGGTGLLVWALAQGDWTLALVAVAAPLAGAGLWAASTPPA